MATPSPWCIVSLLASLRATATSVRSIATAAIVQVSRALPPSSRVVRTMSIPITSLVAGGSQVSTGGRSSRLHLHLHLLVLPRAAAGRASGDGGSAAQGPGYVEEAPGTFGERSCQEGQGSRGQGEGLRDGSGAGETLIACLDPRLVSPMRVRTTASDQERIADCGFGFPQDGYYVLSRVPGDCFRPPPLLLIPRHSFVSPRQHITLQ